MGLFVSCASMHARASACVRARERESVRACVLILKSMKKKYVLSVDHSPYYCAALAALRSDLRAHTM